MAMGQTAAAGLDVCIGQAHDGPVEDFLEVARVASGLGYRRIWIGETSWCWGWTSPSSRRWSTTPAAATR